MKTTLCETCRFGLVREYDCEFNPSNKRNFNNKCLLGDDYLSDPITSCNCYKNVNTKVTYHDPDFNEYEESLHEERLKDIVKYFSDVKND